MSTTGGGALAFLNQGTAPSASSNYSQSSTQLPSWYTDYTQQILNTAAQFAAQPYQTYGGPRIAQQDPNTEAAYGQVGALPGTAAGNTQASSNLIQGAAGNNNPLAAAQPYLNAGTDPTYNTVQNYQNPYNQDVTNAIAQAGNTNFQNNVLPTLQSSIIGAGNITGSSTEGANLIQNSELQNEQAISQAQSQALQSGYNGSLSAAQAGNANALTAAGQAASANENQTAAGINAGSALSSVGTQGNANQIAAIGAENTLGQQNQGYNQSNLNLAYNDFLQQQQYPLTQAADMQSALSGIQVPTAQVNYGYGTGVGGANGSATTGSTTSPLSQLFGTAAGANAGALSTANPGQQTTTLPTTTAPATSTTGNLNPWATSS
jgi:hypothetical protein